MEYSIRVYLKLLIALSEREKILQKNTKEISKTKGLFRIKLFDEMTKDSLSPGPVELTANRRLTNLSGPELIYCNEIQ